ncbi:MAG: 50S ribosomal protein L15 [Planctomycetota bacterium]|nr:50S ribosomal protein L15 [Planctomycetota bacterium]
MKFEEILAAAGSHKKRRRVGRGIGSHRGKTCGRGSKGFGARAGWKAMWGYEGGQNPQIARLPKRGFNNYNFRVNYQIVNVSDLEAIFADGAKVDAAALAAAKLIDDATKAVKILGNGQLTKKLTVVAAKFTASAAAKIQQAGGAAETAAS